MKDGAGNFKLCRNHPRKLLILVIGGYRFMTEPTALLEIL